MAERYAGDDTKAQTLLGGISAAYAGIGVEDFETTSDAFLRSARHPTPGRGYLETAYAPMVELLGYLEANGFSNHIVSGSGAEFMRPITEDIFGVAPDRVIGSTSALDYASNGKGGTSLAEQRWGFSTTGRRSRSRSGAASAVDRCWPAGTRTAISRCSTSRSRTTSRPFD